MASRKEAGAAGIVARIDATMKKLYPQSYARLAPAPPEELQARLRRELEGCPESLVALYAWRDGCESLLTLGDDTSSRDFMPLAEVFRQRDRLAEGFDLPDGWMPIFTSTDGAYTCIVRGGALASFDTQGDGHDLGHDPGFGEVFHTLDRALEKVLENMKAELWGAGREAGDPAEEEEIVAKRMKKGIALVEKGRKDGAISPFIAAKEEAFWLLARHGRADAAREVLRAALAHLPRGPAGASTRAACLGLEVDACLRLGLAKEAAEAAEAAAGLRQPRHLGDVARWHAARGETADAARALEKAAEVQKDPWLVGLASVLFAAGDEAGSERAASQAIETLDAALAKLTAPHHATARAATLVRKAVAQALAGGRDEAKATLDEALGGAEPSATLRPIVDEPLWSEVTSWLR